MQRVGKRKREADEGGSAREKKAGAAAVPPSSTSASTSTSMTGHYAETLGENLSPRYKVLALLGQGTFARVLECWDRVQRVVVAVKVIRDLPKYRAASEIEIRILKQLAAADPDDRMHVVRLRHTFEHKNHVCLVYDRLGLSLFDMLRKNRYQPFSTDQIRVYARQLITATQFLHGPMKLVHTDLKPENILLRDAGYEKVIDPDSGVAYRIPSTGRIQVIDFGSAVPMTAAGRLGTICTRHYRAPEVMLGLKWSYPVDMWSIGCILVELYTGRSLFQTSDEAEHLAMIERVIGPIPRDMVARASAERRAQFFVGDDDHLPPSAKRHEVEATAAGGSLLKKPAVHGARGGSLAHCAKLSELIEHEGFRDFLAQIFVYDPAMRLTAAQAAQHPFLAPDPEAPAAEEERSAELDLTAEEDLTSTSVKVVAAAATEVIPLAS